MGGFVLLSGWSRVRYQSMYAKWRQRVHLLNCWTEDVTKPAPIHSPYTQWRAWPDTSANLVMQLLLFVSLTYDKNFNSFLWHVNKSRMKQTDCVCVCQPAVVGPLFSSVSRGLFVFLTLIYCFHLHSYFEWMSQLTLDFKSILNNCLGLLLFLDESMLLPYII